MLTADMARDMSGDQKVTEALEYAADLGMGYLELVELARGRAEELGAERPDLHVVFAENVDLWEAITEIWVVMPWDVDADAFHEVADWLDSRCRFNE